MDIDYSLALSFSKLAIDVFFKSTMLLMGVWLTVKLLRRHSASVLSLILAVVVAGLVLLPALSTFAPEWRVPLLPDPAAAPPPGFVEAVTGDETPQYASPGESRPATMAPMQLTTAPGPRWPAWISLGWLVGAVGCLLWVLSGKVGLRWILRKAVPLHGEPWQTALKDVCEELNVGSQIQLFQCSRINTAVIRGILHPRVILPATVRGWSDQRLRLVLLHELAHISRRDSLVEILACITLVLYWFNPLVWLTVRQMRVERERACDNAVLNAGAKPSNYATQLMEVAADLGVFRRPLWQTAAISEGSGLKDRLLCILDPKLKRMPIRPWTVGLVCALAAAVLLPLSGFTAWCDRPYSPKVVAETGDPNRIAELMEMLDADCCENRLIAVKALATKTDNPKVTAALKKTLIDRLRERGYEVKDFTEGDPAKKLDYPGIADQVAHRRTLNLEGRQ
ncbi:MAG: M56 family metallopeptidase [Planctomycetota bacterium]|nr:M56 family metallopeptidase [Planctomycetota bacterium]